MKSDFLLAITQLSAEKNLPKETVISAVEAALVSAYRKDNFATNQNISVKIKPTVGRVEVWGTDGGKEKKVYYTYVGHIAFITSAPCLQAAVWLCRGKFDHLPGGVYAPERLLEDPEEFLSALRARGVEMTYYE